MYLTPNYVLCKAEPGQNISDFAEQVTNYKNRNHCFAVAVFNDVYIEVDESTTARDIEKEYFRAREAL